MGKSQRQRRAHQRANAAKRKRARQADQSTQAMPTQESFTPGHPVRPGTRLGVHGLLRRFILGTANTTAANLVLDVAHLRADARTLVRDLDRALRRPAVNHHELDVFRRHANRVATGSIRVHRRNRDGWCLDVVGRYASSLAAHLPTLREPGPYSIRVRDSHLTSTKATVKSLLDVFAISVETIAIDMSDADLSGLKLTNLNDLHNVIWTDRTGWPPDLHEPIRDQSIRLARGVFQVVATTDRLD